MAGGVGAAAGCERERDEREAGRQRAVAERELQVERAEQEEPEHETGVDQGQQQAAADGAVAELLDAQERLGGAALGDREGERGPRSPTPPMASVWVEVQPALLGLGDRVDDRGHAAGGEDRAAEVEPTPARLLGVGGNDLAGAEGERDGDRQVDEEDQPPVSDLGEHAAEEDAERGAGATDGTPGGERLRASRAVEDAGDDRERGRGEHRGAEALARAGGEERWQRNRPSPRRGRRS